MSNYNNFSAFYDLFTDNVNYRARTEYLLKLFESFDRRPSLLLDLACGTGNFSAEFAKRGIEVIGVDRSEGMLCEAQAKNCTLDLPVLYLCQSGEELELFGTVDGAVCCLDSLNHITDYALLKRCLERVALFLEPQRLFIFDVNTEYKHEHILGNHSFKMRKNGVTCVWTNSYDSKNRTVQCDLDFHVKNGFLKKEFFSEQVTERAYTDAELRAALDSAGLEVLAVYGENTFKPPKSDSQRNVYVTRKE